MYSFATRHAFSGKLVFNGFVIVVVCGLELVSAAVPVVKLVVVLVMIVSKSVVVGVDDFMLEVVEGVVGNSAVLLLCGSPLTVVVTPSLVVLIFAPNS